MSNLRHLDPNDPRSPWHIPEKKSKKKSKRASIKSWFTRSSKKKSSKKKSSKKKSSKKSSKKKRGLFSMKKKRNK